MIPLTSKHKQPFNGHAYSICLQAVVKEGMQVFPGGFMAAIGICFTNADLCGDSATLAGNAGKTGRPYHLGSGLLHQQRHLWRRSGGWGAVATV